MKEKNHLYYMGVIIFKFLPQILQLERKPIGFKMNLKLYLMENKERNRQSFIFDVCK